jgi:hypothetical protein
VSRTRPRVTLAVALALACACPAPPADAGHEMPFYPSYYPQEITVRTLAPAAAGAELGKGALHAYVGSDVFGGGPPPAGVQSVESLDRYVVLTFNPASRAMATPGARCGAARALLDRLSATPGWTPHPWPVTPHHPDYLQHVDLVEAARAAPAATTAPLRLRASGRLASALAAAHATAATGAWDAVLEEVPLAELVAAASTSVNGWLGPPWVKQGWFHADLLLGPAVSDPAAKHEVQELRRRLLAGAGEPAHERADLERRLVRALHRGCERVVAGYALRREWTSAEYSAGVENVGSDAHSGLNSALFVRTVKLKDFPWNGWLNLGVPERPAAAWNPVGGFTDEAGRLLGHALLDPGLFPQPRGGSWTENRVRVQPAVKTGSIAVPREAVLPEAGTGRLRPVGDGKTARAVLTYRVLPSAFHDATKMTPADALYGIAFAFRWGGGQADGSGHDPYVERATTLARAWLVGVRVAGVKTDVLRFGDVQMRYDVPEIEVYLGHTVPDVFQLASVAPPWTAVPWHVLALLEEAVQRGLGAFSAEEARRRGVPWLDPVRDGNLKKELAAIAAQFEAQGFVPEPLRGLVSRGDAVHRWALLRRFAMAHDHFLPTGGPYRLHAWSADETVLRVFRDFSYPLGVGSYNAWAIPLRAYVARVDVRGEQVAVHAEVERIERFAREYRIVTEPLRSSATDAGPLPVCRYVVLTRDGGVAGVGTAQPDGAGVFKLSVRGAGAGPRRVVLALSVLDNLVDPQVTVVRVE